MTGPTPATNQASAGTAVPGSAEDLLIGILTLLTELADLERRVRLGDVHDTRLGFLTWEGRQAQNEQTREERDVARWNASNGHPRPSGPTPVPGDLRTLSALTELHIALHDATRRLQKAAPGRPYGPVRPTPLVLPANATTPQLLALVEQLARHTTAADHQRLVRRLYRDLTHHRDALTRIADGNDQTQLEDPCPHCGLTTLIVRFRDDLIRCDRDPHTGNYAPCRCSDPLCQCKTKPIAYRHEWFRSATDPRITHPSQTWHKLAGRLKFTRTKTNQPN